MRPTEAVVDLAAIGRNVEKLRAHVAPADLCVVTKAGGYGHGAVAVSRAAVEAGASWIAVALVEEGIELRRAGLRAPILVLSEPRPGEMFEVVEYELTPTVYTPEGVAALVAATGVRAGSAPYQVHILIDSGMNRVGMRPELGWDRDDAAHSVGSAIRSIMAKPEISVGGLYTHFAVADEPDRPETAMQLGRFHQVLAELGDDAAGLTLHASNSAATLNIPDARFDMVRVGIATYGIAPTRQLGDLVSLEPAMQLRTQISLVKPVQAGEQVSYGLRHTFAADTRLATVPIGYADGLWRSAAAKGLTVLVGGEPRPIVGVVTMDQAMVDLGPDSTAQVGDEVVLVGQQGAASISATDVADQLGTIPYEIVCDIGRRVRRRYL